MTQSTEHLIEQLAHVAERNAARAQLVAQGESVVPALLTRLEQGAEPAHRKTMMRILLDLKDGRAEELFRASLQSEDEEIRAISARGLYLLGTDDALEACLATINDAPDMLHFDITPSVTALSQMGSSVVPSLLPLLRAEDERTRQRAQRVLEQVTFREISERMRHGTSASKARAEWRALWEENGSYHWDAPEGQRRDAVRHWQAWLDERALEEDVL